MTDEPKEVVAAATEPKKLTRTTKDLVIVKANYNIQYLRLLVYGDSGVGKTVLMGTAADVVEMSPMLMCDADLGLMSIAKRNDIDVVSVRKSRDIDDVNMYLRANPGRYKTVVIDSLTAVYTLTIRERMESAGRSSNEDPDVPGLRDWMNGTFKMRLLLQKFKTAPVNFLATALVDEREEEGTNIREIRPGLSRKLAREVGAEFDIVGYMYTRVQGKAIQRFLQMAVFGNKSGKSRGALPLVLQAPTMGMIYKGAIQGIEIPAEPTTIEEELKES
jgi:hypothetical protein